MLQQKQWQNTAVGVLASFAISSAAWAIVPNDNRLPAWEDYGSKTVDFTGVAINYQGGRYRRHKWSEGSFFGDSSAQALDPDTGEYYTPVSTFSLNSPFNGVNNVAFDGDMVIDAKINGKGRLRTSKSSFGIYSNDAMFGGPVVEYGCDRKRRNCRSGVLVYGGDLTGFGWSGSQGLLEFEIGNLAGWAWDQWEVPAGRDGATSMEHIMLNVGQFDLGGVKRVRSFNALADGFAVVPVPAAVWLFGSGLLGLVGFARRKKA